MNLIGLVALLLVVLFGVWLLVGILHLALGLLGLCLAFAWPLLMVVGLISCALSQKSANVKVLWIVIIILAPILGPLLWFFWGRKYT